MRKLTREELEAFTTNMNNNLNAILNIGQAKAVLRLMRDEVEGEDKDLFEYVSKALNQQIMNVLHTCIPLPVKIRPRISVWDAADKSDDWFLRHLASKDDWIWRPNNNDDLGRISEFDYIPDGDPRLNTQYHGALYHIRIGLYTFVNNGEQTWDCYCPKDGWIRIENKRFETLVCKSCNDILLEPIKNESDTMR